ncbi:MAG: histidine--tRNA ligase [Candidatus Sungiibacteriota bacterium]
MPRDNALKKNKKSKRIKPDLPGGFRDYGPADAIARQGMLDTIRRTFESFGFDPLETSAVQKTEVLTGGEEDSGKIIFNVRGSQEEADAPAGASAKDGTSLRFDLTVPLARFVAANQEIPKPFKRYQIGTVWRGERQQAGRYREFTQADVDIVGSSSLDADAEMVAIIYTTFKNLGVEKFIIKYNNRKILNALPAYAGFADEKLWDALRIIDKRDKIGDGGVKKELIKEFDANVADKIAEFVASKGVGQEGSEEYEKIRAMLADLAPGMEDYFIADFSLVRGLSYYTGSVFEVILPDAPEIGSVCGGGRYDNLVAQFTGQKIPAVGVSIGVDRLFAAMEKLRMIKKKQTLTQVLILQLDESMKNEYRVIAQELRNVGINAALYLGDDPMLQAQLVYAVKKEIPYVIIYGANEKAKGVVAIKNLATREQKEIPREQVVPYLAGLMGPPRVCQCG